MGEKTSRDGKVQSVIALLMSHNFFRCHGHLSGIFASFSFLVVFGFSLLVRSVCSPSFEISSFHEFPSAY